MFEYRKDIIKDVYTCREYSWYLNFEYRKSIMEKWDITFLIISLQSWPTIFLYPK